MGKKWDTTGDFYEWCKLRATELHRVIKHGGYVLVFGHHKTNHRMKSAFEDVGFNIVEEIDWVYGTGFPKNQDISKMFDKKAGAEREVVGKRNRNYHAEYKTIDDNNQNGWGGDDGLKNMRFEEVTAPSTELAKEWNGWKTSGLKPAKEPITVFQKPLDGKYLDNIEKWNCGVMNIDACRVPTSQEYKSIPTNETGRFPANIIFDTYMGEILDQQSGISKSIKGNPRTASIHNDIKLNNSKNGVQVNCEYNDVGGASRYFLSIDTSNYVPFYYCPKATKKEKGEFNKHVTVKPKELIKWLIKLVTPKDGITIDITAGSGTHGLSCEELNRDEVYNLKWINIEMLNSEKEPYCDIARRRIEDVV